MQCGKAKEASEKRQFVADRRNDEADDNDRRGRG